MTKLITKIFHDENSEPPKDYLWDKGGELLEYKDGKWKETETFGSNSNIPQFFSIRYPRNNGVYNQYYSDDPSSFTIQKNLRDLLQSISGSNEVGPDLPILDPKNENLYIVLCSNIHATSENSCTVTLFKENGTVAVTFEAEISTDQETVDSYMRFNNFNYSSGCENYSYWEPYLKESLSQIPTENWKKIIGEPQVTTQQEI